MDLGETPEQASYRKQVRSWLQATAAQAPRRSGSWEDAAYLDARRAWQRRLAGAGLVGVTWPREYGGQGRSAIDEVIVSQELAQADVPGVISQFAVGVLGPSLIACASAQQKARYLHPLLDGVEVWCELFSEPAAGSDLAAVRTRATRNADESWTVSGQKVWTTNAHIAAFGVLLARTDDDVPKHDGLTMLIVPMDADGVTIRPLRQISGAAEFNEVFLDEVRLEAGAVVGGVGNGWRTTLTILMHERLAIGFDTGGLVDTGELTRALAGDVMAHRDSAVRQRLGEIMTELMAVRLNGYRNLAIRSRGGVPGPEAGLMKITAVNAAIAAGELVLDTVGIEALDAGGRWYHTISFLPGARSGAGTEQILRNTIGERVLGLPAEPRVDKGVAFSELRAREREERGR